MQGIQARAQWMAADEPFSARRHRGLDPGMHALGLRVTDQRTDLRRGIGWVTDLQPRGAVRE